MSVFLNCVPAAIDSTMMKLAYLLIVDQGRMGHWLPYGVLHQHRLGTELPVTVVPGTQIKPSDAAEIIDINVAPAAALSGDIHLAFNSNSAHTET